MIVLDQNYQKSSYNIEIIDNSPRISLEDMTMSEYINKRINSPTSSNKLEQAA